MAADELIWKVKGRKSSYKIRSGMAGGKIPYSTEMKVNINNYKDVALFFQDLKHLWNVNVEQAVVEFKKNEGENTWIF